jgi:hypothetical protein
MDPRWAKCSRYEGFPRLLVYIAFNPSEVSVMDSFSKQATRFRSLYGNYQQTHSRDQIPCISVTWILNPNSRSSEEDAIVHKLVRKNCMSERHHMPAPHSHVRSFSLVLSFHVWGNSQVLGGDIEELNVEDAALGINSLHISSLQQAREEFSKLELEGSPNDGVYRMFLRPGVSVNFSYEVNESLQLGILVAFHVGEHSMCEFFGLKLEAHIVYSKEGFEYVDVLASGGVERW